MQRDAERIQAFHQKVLLRKELPFTSISNSAFAQCMDFSNNLRTQLASVTSKCKTLRKSFTIKEQALTARMNIISAENLEEKERVRKLELQLRLAEEYHTEKEENFTKQVQNLDQEHSKLKETVCDLQNKLSVSGAQMDVVTTLKNQIRSLEEDLDMHKQCCEAMGKKSNMDYLEFAETKRELEQKVAFEVTQKDIIKLLLKQEQQSSRNLKDEINELKQCNQQTCTCTQQQYFLDQNFGSYPQGQPFPYQQPNVPQQCEPMPFQNFRPHRGRRSRR